LPTPAESLIATLKTELIHQHDFHTSAQAQQAIFEYIEIFYSRQRTPLGVGLQNACAV